MPNMNDNSRRILELLAQGKITVDEADQLLRAIDAAPAAEPATSQPSDGGAPKEAPRWMHITIDKPGRDGRPPKQVNIRVPLAFVRSGVKFGAMFPRMAGEPLKARLREQGIDLEKLDLGQIDAILASVGETTIDDGRSQVRIRCE
jgi:hypothetical protein